MDRATFTISRLLGHVAITQSLSRCFVGGVTINGLPYTGSCNCSVSSVPELCVFPRQGTISPHESPPSAGAQPSASGRQEPLVYLRQHMTRNLASLSSQVLLGGLDLGRGPHSSGWVGSSRRAPCHEGSAQLWNGSQYWRYAHKKAVAQGGGVPPASSIFAAHYKASISSRQLTRRIMKRTSLADLRELLSYPAYFQSLDGIAIAATLTKMLQHIAYDKDYKPEVAAQLLQRLEGSLVTTMRWNTNRTSSTILWALACLHSKSKGQLHLSSPDLLASLIVRASSNKDKMDDIAPRRLSLIVWSVGKLAPKEYLPSQPTPLSKDDINLPPSKERQPAAPAGPTSRGLPRQPLDVCIQVALARVTAAALPRLPRLTPPPSHLSTWELCQFSPQGLANLATGLASTNYYSPRLLERISIAAVSMATSPAAPQLELLDCQGLAAAFAHFWEQQQHPELFEAILKAYPAAAQRWRLSKAGMAAARRLAVSAAAGKAAHSAADGSQPVPTAQAVPLKQEHKTMHQGTSRQRLLAAFERVGVPHNPAAFDLFSPEEREGLVQEGQ